MKYQDILDFWFQELSHTERFSGGEVVDVKIGERFSRLHTQAVAGELFAWRTDARGALAEIIVLDQFSRNLYRGKGEAFAADGQALVLAQWAVTSGYDQQLSETERLFLYLPFMHSESKKIHEEALRLFTDLGSEEALKYEKIHKDIIDQFGRYPHRNAQLGRLSTAEELQYLKDEEHDFFKS